MERRNIGRHIAESKIGQYFIRKDKEGLAASQAKTKALEIASLTTAIAKEKEELDRLTQSALEDIVTLP